MPIFTKDPAKAEQKAKEAEEKARALEEAAFLASPQGQARTAKAAGQRFFQIALPFSETKRSAMGVMSGDPSGVKTRQGGEHPGVLESIEAEGWRLEDVGYVFEETGSVSRDKLLSSGQTASVTGRIVGIYLFRASS